MFHKLVIVAVLIVSASAATFPVSRIAGGTPASITEAPYIVAILVDLYDNNNDFYHYCNAIIISRNVVVTSGQCATYPPSRFRIRAGSTYHNSGGQVILVATYVIHEEYYYPTRNNNDIAVFILASPITFGSTANAITLPSQEEELPDFTNCTMFGWGRLGINGTFPLELHKANLPIINREICASAYNGSDFGTVNTNMICAGFHGIGGIGGCYGDVGGPLVYNGILYGIISWGRGCGEPNYPSVFTRVSMYRTWINKFL